MLDLEKGIDIIHREIHEKVYGINEGGCIHFAYFLSKELLKLKVPHKIIFMDWEPVQLAYSKFEPLNHVAVYIPDVGYVDGEFLSFHREDLDSAKYYRHIDPNPKRLDRYRTMSGWNPTYNLNQNKKVARIIKKAFKNANN